LRFQFPSSEHSLFSLLGFSINTLSLFGLVLAIGLVVDDAIVVVEAIEHHIEHGLSPRCGFQGHGPSAGPVVAIALILSAVLFPPSSSQALRSDVQHLR
jgi:HAE1 family hydrophobic/amphiphilic exporter-1